MSTAKLFVVATPAALTPTPLTRLMARSVLRSIAKVSTSSWDVSKKVLKRSLLFDVSRYSAPATTVCPIDLVENSPIKLPATVKFFRCVVSTYPSRSTVSIPPKAAFEAL